MFVTALQEIEMYCMFQVCPPHHIQFWKCSTKKSFETRCYKTDTSILYRKVFLITEIQDLFYLSDPERVGEICPCLGFIEKFKVNIAKPI